jgi:hypothetical protein
MSHFKVKSVVFYGITIGAVVVLFNMVTAYGNANLKAQPKINGRYRINAQNLPDCLSSNTLLLNLEQSGIYLNGSLLSAQQNIHLETLAAEKPSLNGELSYPQLSLSGRVPFVSSCKNKAQQADAAGHPLFINIQGVVQGKTITGQISLNSTPTTAEFIAQLEAPKEKQQE